MILDKKVIYFAVKLIGLLLLLALLHVLYFYVRGQVIPVEMLVLGYSLNFVMAFIIYFAMVYLAKKQNKNLGFFFLFGSTFKFAVYFLIFNPLFKQDGVLSMVEFCTFLVPYFACLILETLALAKLLNALGEK